MPITEVKYTIFVSSPSDVKSERDAVDDVVNKWNLRHSHHRGISFRVWRWENEAIPDVGPDPQAVLKSQIPDGIDLLIGIFWTRLGTPTPRADSGSVEEIEDAIRLRDDKPYPQVSIFFKKKLDGDIDDLDLDQLKGLRAFKKRIQEQALVGEFDEIDQFEAKLERMLDVFAEKTSSLKVANTPDDPSVILKQKTNLSTSEPFEDAGMIEVVDGLEENLGTSSKILGEINEKMTLYSSEIDSLSEKMEAAKQFGTIDIRAMKPFMKDVAKSMNGFSSFIDERIEEYATSLDRAGYFSSLLFDLSDDFDTNEEEKEQYREEIRNMRMASAGSLESFRSLSRTVSSMPRIDVATNQAKKRLVSALDRFVDATVAGLDRFPKD